MDRIIYIVFVLFLMASSALAATCGSPEVRQVIHDQDSKMLDYVKSVRTQQQSQPKVLPKSSTDLGEQELQILQDYDINVSKNYQAGEAGDVLSCIGTLTLSSHGQSLSQQFEYTVVQTEDGQTIVEQKSRGEDGAAFRVLELFAGLVPLNNKKLPETASPQSEPSHPSANPPPADAVFDTRSACLYGLLEGESVSGKERLQSCDELGRLEEKALNAGFCWNQSEGEYKHCK